MKLYKKNIIPSKVAQSVEMSSFYPEYIQNNYSVYEIKEYEIYFAVCMIYMVIPSLYIFFITNNFEMINRMWKYINSSIFDACTVVKKYLINKMVFLMRYFGYYSFSTYTVVKDGKEIFSSYSEHINVQTTRENIKQVDMAKYRICKWIDLQCEQYRKLNDNSEPEINNSKNDIYDFIIHSSLEYKQSRIHRGDFRISTHTQFFTNYRIYNKSFCIENYAELVVPKHLDEEEKKHNLINSEKPKNDESSSTYEIIPICVKYPLTFYIEKNELYDKKFLQWYLLNRICRPDISKYIGSSSSTYDIVLYHRDFIKYAECDNCLCLLYKQKKCKTVIDEIVETSDRDTHGETDSDTTKNDFFMKLKNGQHILVGSEFIIKVDTALHCPLYDINENSTLSIDDDINDFCNQSEQSYSDDEKDEDNNKYQEDQEEYDDDSVNSSNSETSASHSTQNDNNTDNNNDDNVSDTINSEFEIINTSY